MHSVRVREVAVRAHAYQTVVSLGIFGVHKVHVVSGYHLDIVLTCYSYKLRIDAFLNFENVTVASRHVCAVALQFYIIVIAECLFPPSDLFLGLFNASRLEKAWNLATKTCRCYYKPFTMLGKLFLVGTRM